MPRLTYTRLWWGLLAECTSADQELVHLCTRTLITHQTNIQLTSDQPRSPPQYSTNVGTTRYCIMGMLLANLVLNWRFEIPPPPTRPPTHHPPITHPPIAVASSPATPPLNQPQQGDADGDMQPLAHTDGPRCNRLLRSFILFYRKK